MRGHYKDAAGREDPKITRSARMQPKTEDAHKTLGVTDPRKPLRLHVAAALAFPDGSMTASGLRREIARGRLIVERIAGKDYTTLQNIEKMREACRVQVKDCDSICAARGCAFGANPNRKKGGLTVAAAPVVCRSVALSVRS